MYRMKQPSNSLEFDHCNTIDDVSNKYNKTDPNIKSQNSFKELDIMNKKFSSNKLKPSNKLRTRMK